MMYMFEEILMVDSVDETGCPRGKRAVLKHHLKQVSFVL
jgi:hypothetical protein